MFQQPKTSNQSNTLTKYIICIPELSPCNPSGKDDRQIRSICSQCVCSWHPKESIEANKNLFQNC